MSDGSDDATEAVAERLGANVLRLEHGRGKASALAAGLQRFDLGARYKVVLLLDADTELSHDYLTRGLQQFADPGVVAVAGGTTTDWHRRGRSVVTRFLLAHRDRVYLLTQLLQKFGQSWRRTNVVHIVPGAASMYRVEALAEIDLEAPGLVIEDFNMTFEVHRKRLGRIAFHPERARLHPGSRQPQGLHPPDAPVVPRVLADRATPRLLAEPVLPGVGRHRLRAADEQPVLRHPPARPARARCSTS